METQPNQKDFMTGALVSYFKEKAPVFGLELVFLYGSWATGRPHAESDIDLAVLFQNQDLTEEESFDRIVAMETDLYNRLKMEVQILQIHPDFRKPLLYYNAIVQGEVLYVFDFDRYIDLKNEALFQMEDYSLFGIPWLMELAEKNLQELSHA